MSDQDSNIDVFFEEGITIPENISEENNTELVEEVVDVIDDDVEDTSDVEDVTVVEETTESEDMDVDIDQVADTAIEVLQTILNPFDIGEITIDEYDGDDGELIFNIEGDDLAVLIGRHGRTLESIQFLVSAIVRRKLGFRYPVVIDVEGYKDRQRERIDSIADNAARKAISQGKNISLKPMSPYERRLVHMHLKNNPEVYTESEGTGLQRHIVVYPVIDKD